MRNVTEHSAIAARVDEEGTMARELALTGVYVAVVLLCLACWSAFFAGCG